MPNTSTAATTTPTTTPARRTQLAVLDMAGTTVADDGAVEAAFSTAARRLGVTDPAVMLRHVRATMGESKITVFRALFGEEDLARRANLEFEAAYGELVATGACAPVDGAAEAIRTLRGHGIKVALTTGFSRTTQDAVLTALGWHDLVDLTLCPADAGRGRPHPDMVLTALLRLGADAVDAVAVAGDTAYDMRSGRAAGAARVVGICTGAHDEATLREAGATHVLGSIRELPALLLDAAEQPGD
jgi:phosphonatase-like hydrolase